MITRRRFIAGSAVAMTLTIFPSNLVPATGGTKVKNLGFISGIIGKELEGDWEKTLQQVHEYGYTEIETGNYLGESAESFVSFLKHTGLTPVAGGIDFSASDEDLKKGFTLINSLQMKYAVVYWPWSTGGPFNLEECKKSAERLNYLGRECKNHGLILCWHNHNREFTPMETGLPFDFLMNNTDRNLVFCELDLYWVKKGGGDPLGVLKKYPGRFPILHVKDMAPGDAMDFECPGSGIINFPAIFREAYNKDIKHYMVERDNAQDGMACLRSSAGYLRNMVF